MDLVAVAVIRDRRGAGSGAFGEGSMMNRANRVLARRMIESPAGGLVVTAVFSAAFLPWLQNRRRHTAAA
jgi:hypothetical protein